MNPSKLSGGLTPLGRASDRQRPLYFAELLACGCSFKTLRTYGMDLLRWLRFLTAIEVEWNQATRVEGFEFCRWLQVVHKTVRPY